MDWDNGDKWQPSKRQLMILLFVGLVIMVVGLVLEG
jgi:hypothetical protein